MKQYKIMLPGVAEAKEFVAAATKCDFDIDVYYNRVTIDAKSILGVLSLDLTKALTVEFNGENVEFETYLLEKAPSRIHAIHGDTVPFFCLPAAMRGGAGSSGSGYDGCHRLV